MRKTTIAASVIIGIGITSAPFAEEISYTRHIKPIFDRQCAGCHGQDAPPEYQAFKSEKAKWIALGQGPRMNSYSHLLFYTAWPDTGALMRRLDDGQNSIGGKPGNMYRHLGNTEEERQKNLVYFKGWVGGWNLKKWPSITKDELDGITVKY